MTSQHDGPRVTVVGDPDVVTDHHDDTHADRPLTVTPASLDARPDDVEEADCVVVDQQFAPDSWQSVVSRLADASPSIPVVVLLEAPVEAAVADAIEAGADEFLPRSLCETRPGLVARRLGTVGDRRHAGASADRRTSEGETRPDLAGMDATDSTDSTDLTDSTDSTDLTDSTDATDLTDATDPTGLTDATAESAVADRFRLITETVDEVIYVANEDFSAVEYVNPAYEELWGRPAADLYEDPTAFVEGIHPADRDDFRCAFEAMREEIRRGEADESYEFEFRVQRPDGEVRHVLTTGYPVTGADGRDRYVGFVEDVTEHRELERTYRDLFESVSDGLVVHEPESGDILDVNEQYCRLTGYDRDELVGSNVRLIVSDEAADDYETARARIEEAREEGSALFEFEAEREDGERWVGEVHLSLVEVRGRERVLASVRDVTERTRRERAIRTLHAATERMQTAESADDVAEIAVETAAEALDLPVAACWFHDAEAARLEPVTATAAVHERDLLSGLPADRYEYEVFADGDVATYTPNRVNPDNPLETALLLPLGEHGLIAAGRPDQAEYDDVTLDVARTLAEHTATALDRVDRALAVRESRHRLQAIVDRIDEAIFLAPASELPEGQPAPDYVSSGYEEIWGQPLDGLHETYDEGFFGTLHPEEYDGYRALIDRIVADVEAGEADDRYAREYRIERPDGEVRWVHSDFYPTEWKDGTSRVVVVSRDVTDRKERERAVESFHDATAELTTVDTVAAAGSIAVDAAAEVFDLPATAVYRYDRETATLEPTATGPDLPAPDELPSLSSADTGVWESFVDETMGYVDVGEESALAIADGSEALLFPLGGNGQLVVWRGPDALDTDAAGILAGTLEAALNRLQAERQLESRREQLRAQTERARRLESITEVTRRVEAAITTQSTRRGVYESVCAELMDVDPFAGAWIAAAEVGTDRLTPRAVAGVDRDHVEQALGSGGAEQTDPHPAIDAWQTGESRVVDDLVRTGPRGGWRQSLLKDGTGSVAAVPLAHGGVTYGVLAVLGSEPDAFDEQVVDVLSQLGTSIGYALTAIERQRALESDDTLELEFRGTAVDLPFARLARVAGCRVRHERTVRRQGGSVSVYYTLLDGIPADVGEEAAETLPGDVEVVSRGDERAVVERRGSSWFGSLVSSHGGVLRRGLATDGGVELVVELPREADTRTIVDRLETEFPSLELAAQRQHRESVQTPSTVKRRLEQRLSDRQYEALETAHAMGYFAWPRESSGEEVADALGITQPTVNKHIRLGEQKVFSLLFGSATGTST